MLAGAGTGKTRVLTTRFAHLLMTGRAWPGQVLAVTFTNKAAREMRERVSAILGRPAEGLWLGTFHSLCARMLRRHAELVGLTPGFTILDTDDQMRLLKQVMDAAGVDLKRWPAPGLMAAIQRWKDRGLAPEGVTPAEDTEYAAGRARALYAAYQSRLRDLNACDFGDLMLHMVTMLRGNPEVLAEWHRRFRYILVDEYQDTNLVQYLWLRLLGAGGTRTSAASATTTSPSIPGAAPRSRTSSASSATSPAPGWCGWRATTARRARSSPPPRGLIAHNSRPPRQDAALRPQRRRGREGARRLAVGLGGGGADGGRARSRRRSAPATRWPRSPSWSAPASRPAPSRSG